MCRPCRIGGHSVLLSFFFFQAEDGIRDKLVTGVQTCALPIFAAAGGRTKGAILLVHSDVSVTWADLFNEYMRAPAIIDRAVKSGAAAILWMSARERMLLYRHTNALAGELDKIPQAVVAREDALRLARFA